MAVRRTGEWIEDDSAGAFGYGIGTSGTITIDGRSSLTLENQSSENDALVFTGLFAGGDGAITVDGSNAELRVEGNGNTDIGATVVFGSRLGDTFGTATGTLTLRNGGTLLIEDSVGDPNASSEFGFETLIFGLERSGQGNAIINNGHIEVKGTGAAVFLGLEGGNSSFNMSNGSTLRIESTDSSGNSTAALGAGVGPGSSFAESTTEISDSSIVVRAYGLAEASMEVGSNGGDADFTITDDSSVFVRAQFGARSELLVGSGSGSDASLTVESGAILGVTAARNKALFTVGEDAASALVEINQATLQVSGAATNEVVFGSGNGSQATVEISNDGLLLIEGPQSSLDISDFSGSQATVTVSEGGRIEFQGQDGFAHDASLTVQGSTDSPSQLMIDGAASSVTGVNHTLIGRRAKDSDTNPGNVRAELVLKDDGHIASDTIDIGFSGRLVLDNTDLDATNVSLEQGRLRLAAGEAGTETNSSHATGALDLADATLEFEVRNGAQGQLTFQGDSFVLGSDTQLHINTVDGYGLQIGERFTVLDVQADTVDVDLDITDNVHVGVDISTIFNGPLAYGLIVTETESRLTVDFLSNTRVNNPGSISFERSTDFEALGLLGVAVTHDSDSEITFATTHDGTTSLQFRGSSEAIGTAGNDTFDVRGITSRTNVYEAFGRDGDDTFQSGIGGQEFDGGDGVDTVRYETQVSGVEIYLNGGFANEANGKDILRSIENATGSNYDDRLIGTNTDNVLLGLDGDDIIKTKNGADSAQGGAGNDRIFGGTGDNNLSGDDGNDNIFGISGADTLYGGYGADGLYGGSGDDLLLGGFDNDVLRGNRGSDTLNGDEGDDDLRGGLSDDVLNGGDGDDYLLGEHGLDTLRGGEGNDTLVGAYGGGANDRFTDTFVFEAGLSDSADRIRDFEDGKDLLDLSDFGYTQFNDVLAQAQGAGAGNVNTLITFGEGNSVYIFGLSFADFDASDVIL